MINMFVFRKKAAKRAAAASDSEEESDDEDYGASKSETKSQVSQIYFHN